MEHLGERALALLLLIAAAPFLGILMLAIRLESDGGGLFRQERVGRKRRSFVCYKLRTMQANTRQVATHEVDGAAVTKLGRILRSSKLDELPQLWNVVRGDMRLVGPRPCLPSQHELIREREARGVFELPPGITGLAQIHGIDMSDPVVLAECDAEYVGAQSLKLDLLILWRTVAGGGFGDRVSQSRNGGSSDTIE